MRRLAIDQLPWQCEFGRLGTAVALASTSISRLHARIEVTAAGITVTDLGSTNGTLLNGMPCLPGEVFYLEPGDTLQLGDIRLGVDLQSRAGRAGNQP